MVAESLKVGAKRAVTNSPSNRFRREWGKWVSVSWGTSPTNTPVIYYQVPKKALPRAVDRNLIKRRLKAILAPYKETLQGCKLTIGIKKEIKQAKFKELKEDLQGLLAKKP